MENCSFKSLLFPIKQCCYIISNKSYRLEKKLLVTVIYKNLCNVTTITFNCSQGGVIYRLICLLAICNAETIVYKFILHIEAYQ